MITVQVLDQYQEVDRFVVDNSDIIQGSLPTYLEKTATELTGGNTSALNLERYVLWTINSVGNNLSLQRGKGLQLVPPDENPQPTGGFEETQTVVDSANMDAEDEDLASQLVDRAIQGVTPAIKKWSSITIKWLRTQESLENAKSALEANPGALYQLLPSKGFQSVLQNSLVLAQLAGQEEASQDIEADSPRFDARKPEWFRLPFVEAIEYFRQKINVPVDSYYEMEEGYHDWAFSIAHMTRADWLEAARFLIDQAITEGNSLEKFTRQWNRLVGRQGWTTEGDRDRRIYTIFDTNIRSAYGAGRAKQMLDPEVVSRRPLILWRWRDSPNPRLNHQALHNKAIPATSDFWKRCSFPAGWGCRCAGFSITEEYAQRNNIEILQTPPNPETIAEPGFRTPLAGLTESDRQQIIQSSLDRLPPDTRALVEKDLK